MENLPFRFHCPTTNHRLSSKIQMENMKLGFYKTTHENYPISLREMFHEILEDDLDEFVLMTTEVRGASSTWRRFCSATRSKLDWGGGSEKDLVWEAA
ncbi:hypothetical protein P8452_15831 [Trifolium repens]|nr:hypothetical protein P8452_15831 [Trifolium repens]